MTCCPHIDVYCSVITYILHLIFKPPNEKVSYYLCYMDRNIQTCRDKWLHKTIRVSISYNNMNDITVLIIGWERSNELLHMGDSNW
jgi:hypothetical protein